MSVSTEWYGMPLGLKYPLSGFMIVVYRFRNHWSYADCDPAASASTAVTEPLAYPVADAVMVPWAPPSAAVEPDLTVTVCGVDQLAAVKVRLAGVTDRSESPLTARLTVVLADGAEDRATPNVVLAPWATVTLAGFTTTVGDSTVTATG